MKTYHVVLTKVESNHNNLRTNEIEGHTLYLPDVGQGFNLVGESLTPGLSHRMINTTEVKSVESIGQDEYLFKTLNSTYKLKVLGTEEVP